MNDKDFEQFISVLQRNFDKAVRTNFLLYKVSSHRYPNKLWNNWWLYLHLPPVPFGVKTLSDFKPNVAADVEFEQALKERDTYNCSACKKFFDKYGDLVSIDSAGKVIPVFWNDDTGVPEYFKEAFKKCQDYFNQEDLKVKSFFALKETNRLLGTPDTEEHKHISVIVPAKCRLRKVPSNVSYAKWYSKEIFKVLKRMPKDFDLITMKIPTTHPLECEKISPIHKYNLAFKFLCELYLMGAEVNFYNKIF